jgi:hypothetical protein
MAGEPAPAFRNYRAPRQHGESLVDPAFADAGRLIADNRNVVAQHGDVWHSLRDRARRQLVADAIRYTSAYRNVDGVGADRSPTIIMAGHQPTLFHPGVWFKNFALSELAANHQAVAINLVVDNDVGAGSSIRVPTIDRASGSAAYRRIAYDRAGGGVPYEQATIGDRDLFDQFDRAVSDAVRPLVANPCVMQLWQHARQAIDRCGVAGCALAQARHGLEGDVGLKSLEIPLAVVCRSEAFAEFVLSILVDLPRFHRCYNDATDTYRRVHGIRSSAHPVPNLAQRDGWWEAPFWIYGNQSPARRAAWVKLSGDHLLISDLDQREMRVDTADMVSATGQLSEQLNPEFKLRPRALMTTMYARTVLSDLFLHGIGGAKYDQLGDTIAKAYFGITPLGFMVISATIQLPGVRETEDAAQVSALQRKLRETRFQPERFEQALSSPDLIRRKQQLLASIPPRGQRLDWHREITQINQQLSAQLQSVRADLSRRLAIAQSRSAAQAILNSREHPFCVFPLDYLTDTFARLMRS